MNGGLRSILIGTVLIFVGIVLFWCSTRKSLTPTARGFFEGQGTIAIPAGLGALAYGASREAKGRSRQKAHRRAVEKKDGGSTGR
jgi:hypothetical protein